MTNRDQSLFISNKQGMGMFDASLACSYESVRRGLTQSINALASKVPGIQQLQQQSTRAITPSVGEIQGLAGAAGYPLLAAAGTQDFVQLPLPPVSPSAAAGIPGAPPALA